VDNAEKRVNVIILLLAGAIGSWLFRTSNGSIYNTDPLGFLCGVFIGTAIGIALVNTFLLDRP
jgi:hypothetical protein